MDGKGCKNPQKVGIQSEKYREDHKVSHLATLRTGFLSPGVIL
jgi:hypothetical protein